MILSVIQNTNQRLLSYVWKAAVISTVSAIVTAIAIRQLLPHAAPPMGPAPPVVVFFLAVVFAPPVETLLMIPVLAFIRLVVKDRVSVALFSAAIWAGLHSLTSLYWGIVVFFPFFVFSMCFLSWDT